MTMKKVELEGLTVTISDPDSGRNKTGAPCWELRFEYVITLAPDTRPAVLISRSKAFLRDRPEIEEEDWRVIQEEAIVPRYNEYTGRARSAP